MLGFCAPSFSFMLSYDRPVYPVSFRLPPQHAQADLNLLTFLAHKQKLSEFDPFSFFLNFRHVITMILTTHDLCINNFTQATICLIYPLFLLNKFSVKTLIK